MSVTEQEKTIEQQQVERGAAWLDEHYPFWDERINLATLDLQYCTVCILGQTLGGDGRSYWQEVRDLQLDEQQLGFSALDDGDLDSFDRLTEAWRDEIVSRR